MKIYMMRYSPEDEESQTIAFSSKRERMQRLSFETRRNGYALAQDAYFALWEIEATPTKRNMIEIFNDPYACRVC